MGSSAEPLTLATWVRARDLLQNSWEERLSSLWDGIGQDWKLSSTSSTTLTPESSCPEPLSPGSRSQSSTSSTIASWLHFWLGCLNIFFLTLPDAQMGPKWTMDASIIGTNPGVGLRPQNTNKKIDSQTATPTPPTKDVLTRARETSTWTMLLACRSSWQCTKKMLEATIYHLIPPNLGFIANPSPTDFFLWTAPSQHPASTSSSTKSGTGTHPLWTHSVRLLNLRHFHRQ